MDEKIGGLSIDDIVGAATDDLNGKTPQQGFVQPNPVPPQLQPNSFCAECGTPMTGDFCSNCGWNPNATSGFVCQNCGTPMSGEFCGNCGWSANAANNLGDTVCENCGAPMGGEMFCGNCGWKVGTTVQKEFCPECGSVVINGFCQYCQQNTDEKNKKGGWLQRFKDFRDGI